MLKKVLSHQNISIDFIKLMSLLIEIKNLLIEIICCFFEKPFVGINFQAVKNIFSLIVFQTMQVTRADLRELGVLHWYLPPGKYPAKAVPWEPKEGIQDTKSLVNNLEDVHSVGSTNIAVAGTWTLNDHVWMLLKMGMSLTFAMSMQPARTKNLPKSGIHVDTTMLTSLLARRHDLWDSFCL